MKETDHKDVAKHTGQTANPEETLMPEQDMKGGNVDAAVVARDEGGLGGCDDLCRVVVESMREAAVVARGDGTIIFGNAGFAQMVRLPQEKILGSKVFDFLPFEERARFESIFGGYGNNTGKGEFSIITGNGNLLPVHLSGNKVRAGDAEIVCLVMTDITVRKRAEETLRSSHEELENSVAERNRELTDANERLKREAREREQAEKSLKESEEYFRLLIENASDMIVVLKEDGSVSYAGPSVRRVLGYSSKEFLHRNFLDLVVGTDRERVRDRFAQASRIPGYTISLETSVQRKDGGWRTIEIMGRNLLHDSKVVGIVVNGRDITERKHMEEELRRAHDELEARVEERTSELRKAYERLEVEIREHKQAEEERARLATAIEQGGDCVIITDRQGTIQYVNPAFEKTSLYTREEVTGHPFDILKGENQHDAFWDDMWITLEGGNVWAGRIGNRRKDGAAYEVERTMSPIRDNNGKITNYVSVERDMTEQAGLESELRQAQKMQAIGTLAGGIAHDFNNILAAMIGFTELALDDVEKGTRTARHLDHVRKAGYRGRELVKQILTFSRQGEQEKRPVQMTPIVREVLKLMRASLPATVEIRQRMETEEGIIFADPVQIHQLLINLCTNAGQALRGEKGVIEVGLSDYVLSSGENPPHPDMEPGSYVRLSVTDTGPGIDELTKDRIFEPFFTTRQPEAAGMGLSVAYGIVKSHHGSITVASTPGKGATFNIYFKKLKEAVVEEKTARPVLHAARGKGRILFVDDEEALVEIAKQMLERLGYEVVAEKDSVKALKQFQRDPEKFDLVITDQTMPNMTGIELAKKLMSIKKDIPIILCTGFSEVISPETAKAMGIREFVMKPIIKNEMAETIKRVISGERGGKKRQV